MAFDRVKKGDSIAIRADVWNSILDATEKVNSTRTGAESPAISGGTAPGVVTIRNSGKACLKRGVPVSLADCIPGDTPAATVFTSSPALDSSLPLGVVASPVLPGEIGRATVSGICLARVTVSESGGFADLDGLGGLISSSRGPVRILASQGDGNPRLCVVLLGAPASGGEGPYPCRVKGGTAETGFSVDVFGDGLNAPKTGEGILRAVEIGCGGTLPAGAVVLGFPAPVEVTGGGAAQ